MSNRRRPDLSDLSEAEMKHLKDVGVLYGLMLLFMDEDMIPDCSRLPRRGAAPTRPRPAPAQAPPEDDDDEDQDDGDEESSDESDESSDQTDQTDDINNSRCMICLDDMNEINKELMSGCNHRSIGSAFRCGKSEALPVPSAVPQCFKGMQCEGRAHFLLFNLKNVA